MHSYVKWEGKESEFFDVLSGCLEDSILGQKFFSLVMDKLLLDLGHSARARLSYRSVFHRVIGLCR